MFIGNGTISATRLAIGANTYVLTSNGTTASWVAPSGGGSTYLSWQAVQTANFTAVSGYAYPINTTSSAITVTLPASPSAGNYVQLTDYAGTFGTNNLIINPNGSKFDGNTYNINIATNRESFAVVYIDSTQGWIPYSGFNTSTPVTPYVATYLVIGGGGGAGIGGAGAGGFLTGTTNSLTVGQVYTITVGGGGSSGTGSTNGTNGTASSLSGTGITTVSASGGGYGAGSPSAGAGGNGSSGGGGTNNGAGGTGTSGQGNNGGTGYTDSATYGAGGGGGGASAVGSAAVPLGAAGNGGAGTASTITGSSVTFAGGGGGGSSSVAHAAGGGGAGGGGNGSNSTNGTNGTANTGGGGGGEGSSTNGGSGGSGVVIISIPSVYYSGTTTGSPTITTNGSYKVLTFTSSGSYTA